MSAARKTTRVVLRLDPQLGASPAALRAIAELAFAMQAEFAARLIEDRRLTDALVLARAAGAQDMPPTMHIERSLRRQVEALAVESKMAWSFDVSRCAGIFAAECTLHADDILAIALPEIEQMMGDLRQEITAGLANTAGVLLMTRQQANHNRPIVGVVTNTAMADRIVANAVELAQRLRRPLAFVIAADQEIFDRVRAATAGLWNGPGAVALSLLPTAQLDIIAAHVRSLRPKLVVMAPQSPAIEEFLSRPRLLRELGAPILLLKSNHAD